MRGILGADVFINLLLVFIITTGLLLMNTNKSTTIDGVLNNERNMPSVKLAKGTSKGFPAGRAINSATLSVRKKEGTDQYFLNNKPIKLSNLVAELRTRQISSVRVRFDELILHGKYITILDLCTKAEIKDIINVYQIKE